MRCASACEGPPDGLIGLFARCFPLVKPSNARTLNFTTAVFCNRTVTPEDTHMNKSLVLAALVASVALAACGKKEVAPAPVVAPAPAPVVDAAASAANMAASASDMAASAAVGAASAMQGAADAAKDAVGAAKDAAKDAAAAAASAAKK